MAGGEPKPRIWAGGEKRQELTSLYAERLRDSRGPVDARSLAEAFTQHNPHNPVDWVSQRLAGLLGERAISVLRDLYTEAGWAGIAAGRSQLRTAAARKMVTKSAVDWEGWEPGDAEAAAKLIGTSKAPGLKNLLDGANVTIKGIEETRYNDLAGVLARSVADGLGANGNRQRFGNRLRVHSQRWRGLGFHLARALQDSIGRHCRREGQQQGQ